MSFLIWRGPIDPKGQLVVVGRFCEERRAIDVAAAIAEDADGSELIEVRCEESGGGLCWSSLSPVGE